MSNDKVEPEVNGETLLRQHRWPRNLIRITKSLRRENGRTGMMVALQRMRRTILLQGMTSPVKQPQEKKEYGYKKQSTFNTETNTVAIQPTQLGSQDSMCYLKTTVTTGIDDNFSQNLTISHRSTFMSSMVESHPQSRKLSNYRKQISLNSTNERSLANIPERFSNKFSSSGSTSSELNTKGK